MTASNSERKRLITFTYHEKIGWLIEAKESHTTQINVPKIILIKKSSHRFMLM